MSQNNFRSMRQVYRVSDAIVNCRSHSGHALESAAPSKSHSTTDGGLGENDESSVRHY